MVCKPDRLSIKGAILLSYFFILMLVFVVGTNLHSEVYAETRHGNPSVLPKRCATCHLGHGEKESSMLIVKEEELCYKCHGTQSTKNDAIISGLLAGGVYPESVIEDFKKPYRHPVELRGKHHPGDVLDAAENLERHSECTDCHDPHRSGFMTRFSQGDDFEKEWTAIGAVFQFELCYKCHSSSSTLPMSQTDKRVEFSTANYSYHPVEGRSKATQTPSLIRKINIMKCTDCHGSDSGSDAPHGSIYENILKKNYTRSDGSESEQAYSLCYSCHSRTSILSDESFPYHRRHILDGNISCYTCHDSHGSRNYPALLRFNKDPRWTIVNPSSSGRLEYFRRGTGRGGCYLSCHGVDHNPKEY